VIGEPDVVAGYVDAALAAEFPELRLSYTVVDAVPGRSPRAVRERLRKAADRFTGAKAIAMRQQPIPQAYRVFFRHIGIDPDEQRTPIEAIAVERMRSGGFGSRGVVADAILLGTLETGVPLQAFDAAAVDGRVGLRLSREHELLSEHLPIAPNRVIVADDSRPLAVLFGDDAADARVGRSTRRVVLAATAVAGVPPVSVEEALWTAADTLTVTVE
jgi:DNA/RNA-binding domain of Phe-tRNA-synthetase-like protein